MSEPAQYVTVITPGGMDGSPAERIKLNADAWTISAPASAPARLVVSRGGQVVAEFINFDGAYFADAEQ